VLRQSNPLALAMALSTITRQLPQLSALSLHTTHNSPQLVWDELGTATRLTSLSINCASRSGSDKYSVQNVAALRGLTGLQHLVISQRRLTLQQHQQQPDDDDDDDGPGLEVLLGALTALTRLEMPVLTTQGLPSIRQCTQLEVLFLRSVGLQLQLAASDLGALGQLTQLTLLHISSKLQDPEPQQQSPFYAALGKLVCLSAVSAGFWTPAALPVLAALPKLEYIKGAWQDGDDDSSAGATCTAVTCLCGLSGAVPFAAFPNLEVASYCGVIYASSWLSLGISCPKLTAINTDSDHEKQPGWASFPPNTDSATRVAAIQGLSSLTGLTALTFYVSDAFEMAALMNAVPQVRHLQLADCGTQRGCWLNWLLLGRLSFIRSLSLDLWGVRVQDLEYFTLLLAAVSHVPKVKIYLSRINYLKCSFAARQSRDAGMKLPPGLTIRQVGE